MIGNGSMDAQSIQLFFRNKLANTSEFADLDTSPQSNTNDLLIKPHTTLSASIFEFINYLDNGSSLANADLMSSAQLDNYMSNFFINRRTQSYVTVSEAVYLAEDATEPLEVYTTDTFTAPGGVTFNPTQNYVFVPSTLPVISVLGTNYRVAYFTISSRTATAQVAQNTITSSSLSHPSLIRVTNEQASSIPAAAETNAEFVARSKKSYGNRTFLSNTAFNIAIPAAYPSITDMYAIGYGDPEMQRDISIQGKAWSFHAGGLIDLYVRSTLKPSTFTVQATRLPNQNVYRLYMKRYKGFDVFGHDSSNPHPGLLYGWEQVELPDDHYMVGASVLPELPLLFIDYDNLKIINVSDATINLTIDNVQIDPDTANYKIFIRSFPGKENLRFSIYEQLEIDIYCDQNIGEVVNVVLPYYTADSLEDVQNFITQSESQFKCADTVVKSFVPVEIVRLNIVTQSGYALDEDATRTALTNAINTWSVSEPISISTLLQNISVPVRLAELGRDFQTGALSTQDISYQRPPSLSSTYSGPTYAEMRQHNINGDVIHYYSTRRIGMIENFSLSASQRTVRYFINPENITFSTE